MSCACSRRNGLLWLREDPFYFWGEYRLLARKV